MIKVLWVLMAVAILWLQYRLWVGEGSLPRAFSLQEQIEEQRSENATLAERNQQLDAEVQDLRSGEAAIEERARGHLGMVREGETFFLVIEEPEEKRAKQ